jgi:seryl-tRNA synthetase
LGLAKKFDLIDFELGNKLTGSGFPVYKGKGAKLQRALVQYFLDYNTLPATPSFSRRTW